MQIYFVKATYTNNVYKLGDFFLNGDYKLNANKMLDINLKPDDAISSFRTRHIVLPDMTTIRDHTHIIVPEYEKIYKISSTEYMNNDQYMIVLDEDALLGQYLTLKDTDIILHRTNEADLFRGVHDIADLTLEETIETKSIASDFNTGKWALLFFQYSPDDDTLGLVFDDTPFGNLIYETSITTLVANYPEIATDSPETIEYFQEIALAGVDYYQCVYYASGLKWVKYNYNLEKKVYFDTGVSPGEAGAIASKISKTDVMTTVIALPFETDFFSTDADNKNILSYDKFVGPVDTSLIDIKIVSDAVLKTLTQTTTYDGITRELEKRLTFETGSYLEIDLYEDAAKTTKIDQKAIVLFSFRNDIDISAPYINNDLKKAEPFYKYDLYVYGKKYQIPYELIDDIHLLIAMNSGVINYLVYYKEKRNIIASGSFTHSVKWQIDGLDSFYSQNPTYKDQFFTKMATDSIKTIVGGAVGGSVIPGLGTAGGVLGGVAAAGVDAGLSMINLNFQEKSLRLKPDQVFGENSDVTLQVINIFGIYWVRRESLNIDWMLTEYDLKGFPTATRTTIDDLLYYSSTTIDGSITTKVIFGELKKVIKNEYTTAFINSKLQQGVIFTP